MAVTLQAKNNGSVWHNGSGAPSAGLGVSGDFYLDNDNGDVYNKIDDRWWINANLKGPAGNDGSDGTDGVDGINGLPGADGLDGTDGKEVELRKTDDYIQWRYVGDTEWINLLALSGLGGGAALTVVNLDGTSETTEVSIIRLDQSTGISITHNDTGEVTIGLGSSFKTWKVSGQSDLVAEGEDTIEIIAGTNIVISTNPDSDPKSITISATTSGGGTASDEAKYYRREIVDNTLAYAATNEVSNSDNDANWNITRLQQLDQNNTIRTVSTVTGSWANKEALTYTTKLTYEG